MSEDLYRTLETAFQAILINYPAAPIPFGWSRKGNLITVFPGGDEVQNFSIYEEILGFHRTPEILTQEYRNLGVGFFSYENFSGIR